MKKVFLLKYVFIFLWVFLFIDVIPSFAQTNNKGLSITPYSFDFSLNPGDSKVDTIYLTNLTNQPLDIAIDTRNFTAQGEDGDVNLTTEGTGTYSLSKWISVEPNKITIPAQSKIPFVFTVNIPTNAEPGSHFGSIVFATVPKKEANQTGALLSQEVGALVFVKTPGNILEHANILSFVPEKSFYEFGPVNFSTRIHNRSTIHIKPTGTITITDMFGKNFTVPFNAQNILPNATRKIITTWNSKLLIGKYHVSVTLHYGTKNSKLIASTDVYGFPIIYGLLIISILLAIILITVLATMVILHKHIKGSH